MCISWIHGCMCIPGACILVCSECKMCLVWCDISIVWVIMLEMLEMLLTCYSTLAHFRVYITHSVFDYVFVGTLTTLYYTWDKCTCIYFLTRAWAEGYSILFVCLCVCFQVFSENTVFYL